MALTDYELTPAARRTLNLFLMIDVSGSMAGEKIAAVNDAVRNVIPIINGIGESNPDAEIKISAMTFSNTVDWLTPQPVTASGLTWNDQSASGMTCLGEACKELNRQLSHKTGFLKSASGSYAPVVILLSDGGPTDDFTAGMNALNNNAWFRHSTRIAIAIGNDADTNVLATFTGNPELVFRVHNIDALKTVIKVAVVTSSMVCSQSSSVSCGGTISSPANGSVATANAGTPIGSTPSKSQLTADAIAMELRGELGIDVGDDALMNELDIDEFD